MATSESQNGCGRGCIAKAQQPDGYLNTYFSVVAPDKRWANLGMWHELYCAGHLIEAAIAYWEATGKSKFLDVVCRYADAIDSVFGPGKKKPFDEKTLRKVDDLAEEWREECSRSYGDREFNEATTGSGIKLKPVYTPVDINDGDFAEIGLPGVYPYARGPELRGYQAQPWMMRLGFGFG